MMNSNAEEPKTPKDTLTEIIEGRDTSAKDEQIENLSEELTKEKDARKEDRFLVILAAVILADMHAFSHMSTWTGPLAILGLEAFVLLFLAKRNGIEEAVELFDYLGSLVGKMRGAFKPEANG